MWSFSNKLKVSEKFTARPRHLNQMDFVGLVWNREKLWGTGVKYENGNF